MAPRKMPKGMKAQKRFEILRSRAAQADFSTPKGSKLIFDYYQKAGYLPAKDAQGHAFKSLDDFLLTIQKRVEAVKAANPNINNKEALKIIEARLAYNKALRSAKTGEDVAKITDLLKADPEKRLAKQRAYSGLPLTISDTGKIGINRRQYMSADGGLPRPVFDEIASRRGVEEATRYEKAVKDEWKKMGDVGRQLSSETGIPFHRGHWLANKYGGAESARAGSLEIGSLNELHGAAPRGDISAVAETGRGSMGWLEDFTNWDLAENKLNVLGSEHLKQADLQAISNGVDPNRLIAQRTAEFQARGNMPDPDEIGFIFGSQLDRNETIQSQFGRLAEEQKLEMERTGFDPRYGRPVSSERLAEVTQDVNRAKRSIPEIPKTGGRLAPVLATEPVGNRALAQKLMPDRNALRAMAAAGLVAPSVLGTAASAAESAGRVQLARQTGNPMDWVQAGLAGASSAGDIAGYTGIGAIPGEVMSTAADLANVAIDSARMPARRPSGIPTAARSQARTSTATAARTRGQTMPKSKPVDLVNEAKYFITNPIGSAFNKVFGNRGI